MRKWLFLSFVLAGGGLGLVFWSKHQKPNPAVLVSTNSTTATIAPRSIHFVLNAAGDIGPADQVSVRPEINGLVSELPVDIGDTVKKGDLLFALNDRDLQTDRSSRVTDIEGSKLQVEKTLRYYERSQKLYADKLISQEVYEDSKTDYDMAKNALERSEKALRTVEDQLSKTHIKAPFDCTVLTRPISMGQAVSGSGGFNSGTEVVTIANLKDMIISAHVNQADVAHMTNGQTVEIEVEAVPGLKFKGVVERIAPQATHKNNLKGFDVQILLKDVDSRARPGMTANIAIPLISAENVLAVPLSAVFTEEGERYAYVRNSDGFETRPIQIGVSDYQYAEVLGGLAAGDVVSLVRPANAGEFKPKPAPAVSENVPASTNAPFVVAKSAGTNGATNTVKRSVL